MDKATLGVEGVSLRYNSKKLDFNKPINCWLWVVAYCRRNKFYILTNRPLSRNIYSQLREVISPKKVSSRELYEAIGYHVNSIKYINRLRAGAERYNMWGNPDGVVTEEEATHARKRLVELHSAYLSSRRKAKKKGVIVNAKKAKRNSGPNESLGNNPKKRVLTLNKTN
tara:strand:+ start:11318 stop:11824 length:507 start_codon:yes stop_codon:yes gene_type:complete